jgi:AcrR family transcriptional regulator
MKTGSKKGTHQYKGMKAADRTDERRQKFIMAGIETFGKQGYARTGIRAVCCAAGLTERYFYESFESKEDLLIAVYRMIIEEQTKEYLAILAQPGITPRDMIRQGIHVFYAKLRDDPRRARVQFFEVLGVSPRVDNEYLTAMGMMADMITGITKTVIPGAKLDGPSDWIIPTGIAGSMVHIAIKWVLNGYDVPLDDLVERIMDMLVAGGESMWKS